MNIVLAAAFPVVGALIFARSRSTGKSASRTVAEWLATWLVRLACLLVALAAAVEKFGPNVAAEYKSQVGRHVCSER